MLHTQPLKDLTKATLNELHALWSCVPFENVKTKHTIRGIISPQGILVFISISNGISKRDVSALIGRCGQMERFNSR